MTIDKTIEFFNGLECHTSQAKDARDVAVDTMRKYQKLEQEPIIDKIRAEIEQLSTSICTETRRIYIDADDFKGNVLEIFDKYKAESGDKDG